jgi:N-sulfoglucosamine sulfohydrolase
MRLLCLFLLVLVAHGAERPNIIWIVGEDTGPELGCYGDQEARTPNLDRMAREGLRFTRAFTHAPVCAPSRSGLITGRYPTTIGTHHMRSKLLNPPPLFTDYLRKAGYFVSWPGKTDFNFDVKPDTFDSTKPWHNNVRSLPKDRPFFAYVNLFMTHESQIRSGREQYEKNTAKLKPEDRHDPAKMAVPPYHPDAPEVRHDLAQYYDLCTAVDYEVGEILRRLKANGLDKNTIVFFFGDHGRGIPRSKRWVYDSGTHVPLIVWAPEQFKPAVREDLVSFIDFAPTMLALAGVDVPKDFQGQVFLGPKRAPDRKYVYAARDRMDETFDRIRSVRDERYQYVRNFFPELPYAQRNVYNEENPTMQAWRKWNAEGKLNAAQKAFFAPTKPKEELYDTQADPYEVANLADAPALKAKLEELRAALDRWIAETGDLGAVPETELVKRGLVADVSGNYKDRKVEAAPAP